jgi:chromatin assembly factor 1 subunit B
VSNRDSLVLPGHSSYIQGVAWDPINEYVVTQSADRSCKVHKVGAQLHVLRTHTDSF